MYLTVLYQSHGSSESVTRKPLTLQLTQFRSRVCEAFGSSVHGGNAGNRRRMEHWDGHQVVVRPPYYKQYHRYSDGHQNNYDISV